MSPVFKAVALSTSAQLVFQEQQFIIEYNLLYNAYINIYNIYVSMYIIYSNMATAQIATSNFDL